MLEVIFWHASRFFFESMSDWKKCKLGDIIELQRGYDLPHAKRCPGDYPIVSSSGITGTHSVYKVNPPGVVTGRYGTIGEVFYTKACFWPLNTTLFVSDFKGNFPRFVYYLLQLFDFQRFCEKSTVPGIKRNDLYPTVIKIPLSIKKQKLIAQVLSSLDEKIDLNRQLNDNLEAMAQALYDYWFVQFDFPDENGKPYKSSGGKMVWNEVLKREIPEGWSAQPLFDVASVLYGYPFKTELFTEESSDLPIIRIRDILENTFSAYSREPVHEKYLTHKGDLLIGMDGNFHLNYWHRDGDGVNQRVVRIRSSAPTVSNIQLKLELTPYIKMREANVTRSTVGHLSDKDFKERYILVAAESVAFNPAKVLDALLDRITSLVAERQKLSKQRDFLLPLLMNGQVQVKPQGGLNYHLSAD